MSSLAALAFFENTETSAHSLLLFSGLTAYLDWNSKGYFFGCSSLTSQDPHEGISAYLDLLGREKVWQEFVVSPRAGWECELRQEPLQRQKVKIPSLFAVYLRYGAKICGPPAIDREFKTIDYLMLFDRTKIDPKGRDTLAKAIR